MILRGHSHERFITFECSVSMFIHDEQIAKLTF